MVLEVGDIDPAQQGSRVVTVLYDGLIYNSPEWCTYALFNGGTLYGDVTFTRIIRPVDAEVRSATPGQGYRTRLPGALSEGAECSVSESPALQFFSAFVPAANEKIVVSYRGYGRAVAHVNDPSSIDRVRRGNENGVLGAVCEVVSPEPRTSVDCKNAALALLDDSVRAGWAGEYRMWSDFLAPSEDIYPGDAMDVNVASQGANFRATVREVQIQVRDLANDRAAYWIRFADDQAEPLALAYRKAGALIVPSTNSIAIPELHPGLASLTAAEVIEVTSSTVSIDTGISPPSGGGIEVRRSDAGWGPENDRNLIGRYGTRVITVPRLSRVQDYFFRQYDTSSPPNYSEFSAVMRVDYPL